MTKSERIKEIIVHTTVNHIDPFRSTRGAHVNVQIIDKHVFAFDQLHAHLLREKRVFKIRAVVGTRCHHNHGRVIDAIRCDAAQGVEQQIGVVCDRGDFVF